MQYRQLPGTDLSVSAICLGAGAFGSTVDTNTAFALLDQFVDAGGTFIDTARAYAIWAPAGAGASEGVIGAWLKTRKTANKVVVASKGGHPEWSSLTTPRMTRADIETDCEASLSALGMEAIPLYWLHRDDPTQPVDALLETLERLVDAGKIRYYGCSNWRPDRIRAAQSAAQHHGWHGFSANQPMWSLARVNMETMPDETLVWLDAEGVTFHRETRIPVVPFTAQARGVFAKVARSGWDSLSEDVRRDYDNKPNRDISATLETMAREKATTVTALAIAWLIDNPDFVTIPIVSARSQEQWQEILASTQTHLTPDERTRISG